MQVSVFITDIDNTLCDWVYMWYSGFSAMLDKLVQLSGVPRATLQDETREVFQRHGTSEYRYVIQELPSLIAKHPDQDLGVVYHDAIKAYRQARQNSLTLYPGVRGTLKQIKRAGSLIIGCTEALAYHSAMRVKSLQLDGVLDLLYSPPNLPNPHMLPGSSPHGHSPLQQTVHRHIPTDIRKPNPKILLDIMGDEQVAATQANTVYVGDSLLKDILMAQDAGVADVHAKYGSAHDTEAYELLRAVSHWTQEDIEREKTVLAGRTIAPTYVLDQSLEQICTLFEFVQHTDHKGAS